ncbi:hypothetical protein EBT31_03320 [bacterium]|nr:hypothetical protein [bacterium]
MFTHTCIYDGRNETSCLTNGGHSKADDGGMYGEIPVGFTCDAKPIEDFFDTHKNSTSALGMFGIQCASLAYKGTQIANINHGSLIDLDVSDDGLLAVSINMGSYDPTYVYIVDILEK